MPRALETVIADIGQRVSTLCTSSGHELMR
jgi:hypothetical protein